MAAFWQTLSVDLLIATRTKSDTLQPLDRSGMLDQYLMGNSPLFVFALSRVCSRWLLVGLPICLLSPIAGWVLGLDLSTILLIICMLALATPAFTAIGVLGAALSVGIERGGVLLAILVLPLYVPIFLLGVGICRLQIFDEFSWGPVFWLMSITSATLTLIPFAISASLKICQEY